MKQPGFSLDQLMELAGLGVATAVHQFFTEDCPPNGAREGLDQVQPKVLVICGPGNNGGDGIVAARHLYHFGYSPTLLYPRRNKLFDNLVTQCEELEIGVMTTVPPSLSNTNDPIDAYRISMDSYDLVVDAIFGFSFKGPIRLPYLDLIHAMARTSTSVVSVDVPSGWNVDSGDETGFGFVPAAVISLSYPKLCMKGYQGVHYLGGR